jgi:predicted DNA-binding transcriptional regulator AlpA
MRRTRGATGPEYRQVFLSKKQTAELLNLSERTVDRLARETPELKKIRISPHRVAFLATSVQAYVARVADAS